MPTKFPPSVAVNNPERSTHTTNISTTFPESVDAIQIHSDFWLAFFFFEGFYQIQKFTTTAVNYYYKNIHSIIEIKTLIYLLQKPCKQKQYADVLGRFSKTNNHFEWKKTWSSFFTLYSLDYERQDKTSLSSNYKHYWMNTTENTEYMRPKNWSKKESAIKDIKEISQHNILMLKWFFFIVTDYNTNGFETNVDFYVFFKIFPLFFNHLFWKYFTMWDIFSSRGCSMNPNFFKMKKWVVNYGMVSEMTAVQLQGKYYIKLRVALTCC